MTALADAEQLTALRADYGHAYEIGHDSDSTWWAVRLKAGHAPLQDLTAGGLRGQLEIDDRNPW
jgi:hypothetical protein